MIPDKWLNYLTEHILLKHETLNLNDINEDNGIVHIPVIKRTARTRRVVAQLSVGLNEAGSPPDKLKKAFNSPKGRKHFDLTDETYNWIRYGWIIREYRLQKDERTVKSEQYRMGLPLYEYLQQLQAQTAQENRERLLDWQVQWENTDASHQTADSSRAESLVILQTFLTEMSADVETLVEGNVDQLGRINAGWRFQKQLLFLHFLLALYQIAREEAYFDWKQIGARYYRQIGGSKEFDSHKKEFIEEAERTLERPLHLLGLASLGTITPIFFTGNMQGKNVSYRYGSVHATTDLAVFTDSFQTQADILWLVENRGVLTRMAYETDFLIDSNSFVLGMDGQLRSAHKALIKQLAPCVKQVIIWTDVDEAGLTIAKDLAQVVQDNPVTTKWVVPPLEVVTTIEQFEQRYRASIQTRTEEQEQAIGGVEHWKTWINH